MKRRETPKYSREEQLKILKEIQSGQITLKGAAQKYGISPSGIIYWKIHFGMRPPHGKLEKARLENTDETPKSAAERALEKEVEELKVKLAELYLENDFLKKARAFADRQKKLDTLIITDQNVSQFKRPAR